MPNTANDLAEGSAPRTQTLSVQQSGDTANATILCPGLVRGMGRVKRYFAGLMTTALGNPATHDVIPKRYTPKHAVARSAQTMIPLADSTGLRLDSTNVVGVVEAVSALAETIYICVLQAAAAGQVTLAAAASALEGLFADADIEILSGTGVGQKNRITSYNGGTKVALIKNAVGTPNWMTTPDNTSQVRVVTRRYVVDKDDQFTFGETYTAGGGSAGADCLAGVDIEFDDNVTV